MRTATIREAQHHLSALMKEVAKGGEIILTRRGKEVGKLVPVQQPEDLKNRKIDWSAWALMQKKQLAKHSKIAGSALDLDREDYRW